MTNLLEVMQEYFTSRAKNPNDGFYDYLENVVKELIQEPESNQLFKEPNGYTVYSFDTLTDALTKAGGIKKEDLAILRFDLALSSFWEYLSQKGQKPQNIYPSRIRALADIILISRAYLSIPKAKFLLNELSLALEFLIKGPAGEDKNSAAGFLKAAETEE